MNTWCIPVYEYVPDSEEASASQAESVISSSSMDEVEFQSKTQRFLENMEKLRKEIQEDTEMQDYEEEVVEELEIDEQGYGLRAIFFINFSIEQNYHIYDICYGWRFFSILLCLLIE